MREWLTNAVLQAAETVPDDLEGYVLGRGLPYPYMKDMGLGLWRPSDAPAPDEAFRRINGTHGQYRDGWLSIPLWSPRGRVVGVAFRRWQGAKEMRDYRTQETAWIPVFEGLTPSALNRIWAGGDVWIVEGVFDMTLAHVVPHTDIVLSCGTARLSRNQLNFLARFMSPRATVHIVFDEDETGRRQVGGYTHPTTGKRVMGVHERLRRVGMRCRVVRYSGGKDPGEIWERGGESLLRTTFTYGGRHGR
jgi:hypothetical protein